MLERAYLDNLAMLTFGDLAVDTIWLVDGETNERVAHLTAVPMPRGGTPVAAAPATPDDLAFILYTSGTTGPSKGVCCPHAQYFWWGVNTASLLQLRTAMCCAQPAAVPHQRAQHLLPGAPDQQPCTTRSGSRRPGSSRRWSTATRPSHISLGAMVPILLSRPVTPEEPRIRCAGAGARGAGQFHDVFTRRTGIRLLDGWGSTETNCVLGARSLPTARPDGAGVQGLRRPRRR